MNEQEQFESELKRCLVAVKSQVDSVREKTGTGIHVVELPESFLTLFESARAYAGLVDSELASQFCQFDSWVRIGSFLRPHEVAEFEEWLEWLALIHKNDSPTLFFWWQKRLFRLDEANKERRTHNDWKTGWRWHWGRAIKVFELLASEAVEYNVHESLCFELSARIHQISLIGDCAEFAKELDNVFLVAKQVDIRKKSEAKKQQDRKEREAKAVKSIAERFERGELRFDFQREDEPGIFGKTSSEVAEENGVAERLMVLQLYSNGLADKKLAEVATIFGNNEKVNDRLEKMHKVLPIPPTISAKKIGEIFGVTKAAIQKTNWYIKNRKGEDEKTINRRHIVHKKRSEQFQADFQDESFD